MKKEILALAASTVLLSYGAAAPLSDYVGTYVFTAGDYNSDGAPPNRIMVNMILPGLIAENKK